jgi:hypothetical protein
MSVSQKGSIRPQPPELLLDEYVGIDYFVPSQELDIWVRETFLDERSALFNPEHWHLIEAHIGYLWTNTPNIKGMRPVAATAEIPFFRGTAWQKARQTAQMCEWFGTTPDFLITFDSRLAAEASDNVFCARSDHELYHCAQKLNQYDEPMFNSVTDRPIYCIKSHDVEEHIGVVRRWGIGTVANGERFLEAALAEPEIAQADINLMCGTCM